MLRLRASSPSSNAYSRRRRSASMSSLTLCLAALLLLRGVSGTPIKFFANPPRSPLGECGGDCDNDGQCADGLTCYIRVPNEKVPGCTGGGSDGSLTDYCIRRCYRLFHCKSDCRMYCNHCNYTV